MKKYNWHFSYRFISICIIALLAVVSISVWVLISYEKENDKLFRNAESVNTEEANNETKVFGGDFTVDKSFNSHLPIVVIDTKGQEFKNYLYWNPESHTYVSDEDPNDIMTDCNVYLYDNEDSQNYLSDEPETVSEAKIRYRGNTSQTYEKKQYLIKFVDDNGEKKDVDVFGMGNDNSWILNGSMIDKSMMRNFLAYKLSAEIMEYAVDCEYCEMLFYNGTDYEYMGVFLMTEKIGRGEDRVNIGKYSQKNKATSYIVRRDRYDKWKINLKDYAFVNDLAHGALQIEYPNEDNITDAAISYIENDISEFEKALYSDDPNEFIKYRNYIDMQSFADYFIINELLQSYDAGFNSTYMYKDYGGKLTMGPTWDFDGDMDNYKHAPSDVDTIAFQNSPWFDRMMLDPVFCSLLVSRYNELRQDVLSDENIDYIIDSTVEYLGSAQNREWARWGYKYINNGYLLDSADRHGIIHINRNLNTFPKEINKLKTIFARHADWLDKNNSVFYLELNTVEGLNESDIWDAEYNSRLIKNKGSAMAIVYIAVFLIAVILLQKEQPK